MKKSKNSHNKIALLFTLLVGCQQTNDAIKPFHDGILNDKVIYGDDGRRDLYEMTDPFYLNRANSTVALMQSSDLRQTANGWQAVTSNFGQSQNLCPSERFREQGLAAFCSGSLIAPDIVLTAGHCVTSTTQCQNTRFVFGFAVANSGQQRNNFSGDDVYQCREVIHTEVAAAGSDFALVRLNREVVGRAPLNYRRSGQLSVGEKVFVIGHPVGLPTKITVGAQVRKVQSSYFVTNLDTYGGNSGSAVFNEQTGEIEGILVRGENDFVNQGGCQVSYKCQEDSCRGEDVTYVAQVLRYLTDPPPAPPGPPTPPPQPPKPPTRVVFSSNLPVKIPDNSPTGVTSVIRATSAPNGKKVKVEIQINHSYIGDLSIVLQAPDNSQTILHNRGGGNQVNISGVYGENLKPVQALEGLSNVSKVGDWKLTIRDLAVVDVGTLMSWKVIYE